MKKIFIVLVACGTMAATLNSCNDAEATKKQQEAENVLIEEQATAKVTELTDAAKAECDATVLTAAQAEVTRLAEEAAKTPGKKPVAKPKAKPVVKKEEPKKEAPKSVFDTDKKAGDNKPKSVFDVDNKDKKADDKPKSIFDVDKKKP
jgi:rRNA maturation endonuclease Nob1